MVNKTKFADSKYNVSVIAKGLQMTDAIQQYVREKVSKIEHFTNQILDVGVILDTQKLAHTVSIVIKFLHYRIKASATTGDVYSAIDLASDKITKVIRKYKTKLQSHRIKDLTSVDMTVNVLQLAPEKDEIEEINEQIEEENLKEEEDLFKTHQIVAKEKMPLKTLTQEEAIMKMDLSGEHFLIYRGEEDRKLKVLYRRDDGQFGVVEVE
jgi:putative sigma-54 modulation protein